MNFVDLLLLVFPAFVSNSAPVLFGGGLKVDFNKNFFDGRRLFGDSKTIRGFLSGVLAGFAVGIVLASAVEYFAWLSFGQKLAIAFLVSLGAMAGDLLGSFVKRRLGAPPGSQYFLLDQLLFVITALALAILYAPRIFTELDGWHVLGLLMLTYFLHLFFNLLAHRLKLKKVPW